MGGRAGTSNCIAATGRCGCSRHGCGTRRLGVGSEELFSDRRWRGVAWLGVVRGRVSGMRRACSCRCVGSNGGGRVGGRD